MRENTIRNDFDVYGTKKERMIEVIDTYHDGQLYGAKFPYTDHLFEVQDLTLSYQFDPGIFSVDDFRVIEISAFGHDLLEDTNYTEEELRIVFGDEVADIIVLLTDLTIDPDTGEELKTRKQKHPPTYRRLAASRNLMAMFIKLCDRICNVRFSKENNPSIYAMYKKEYAVFRSILFPACGEVFAKAWAELDLILDYRSKP